MKALNTRISKMVLAVAAVVAMAACGPSSQERGESETNDSTSGYRHAIPAAAAAILEQADHFELLSLNPEYQRNAAKSNFYGYRVLGTAVIEDPETRKKIVSSFKRAVAENEGVVAACFNPRHGIRVTRNQKQADFVICFECDHVQVFGDGYEEFLITNSAQATFDSVLRSNGVPRMDR